ncbi:MAG TPA: hypothetical protein DDY49_14260 [Paenibacillaceae bacterium]|nr:hypothetical protein [Paenibacillaceae bacterium]
MLTMFYALSAIGLMFVANFSVIFSKKTEKKFLRVILLIIAAASLVSAFLFMLAVLAAF